MTSAEPSMRISPTGEVILTNWDRRSVKVVMAWFARMDHLADPAWHGSVTFDIGGKEVRVTEKWSTNITDEDLVRFLSGGKR